MSTIRIRGTDRVVEIDPITKHGQTKPVPTDDELEKIYSESYYNAWGFKENPIEVNTLKTATAKLALSYLPRGEQLRILDCGAAHGVLLVEAQSQGMLPYAIERNPSTADHLKILFGADNIYTGLFETANFPTLPRGGVDQFDAITMCDFIEHVQQPESVLKKAAELLKPGGTLIITTPQMDSMSAAILGEHWPHLKEEHLNYFSVKSISMMLESVGVQVAHVGASKKCLSLDYLNRQFATYGPKPAAFVTGVLHKVCPGLHHKLLVLQCGEMLVVGTKIK